MVILCVCVCVSVTMLAATYLFYMLKTRLFGSFKIYIVWILLKMLCLKVLATFADHRCLLRFVSSSRSTRDDYFISILCRSSDSAYNSTDSSLVTVGYQQEEVGHDHLRTKSGCVAP